CSNVLQYIPRSHQSTIGEDQEVPGYWQIRQYHHQKIGRAHVCTPVTQRSTLFPYTTLFRSCAPMFCNIFHVAISQPLGKIKKCLVTGKFANIITKRSEEHTSALQSHRDLHSFPTRRSSDLVLQCSAIYST